MDFVLKLTHPRPKHFLKRSAAMRIRLFAQDAVFFTKSMHVFEKYDVFFETSLNPCQPS
jgi:hypothetical protein